MRKPFFIVIRGSDDPSGSGVGQFVGAFENQGAAEDEVVLQSQYNPETSGYYYIAEFEAQQAGALVALSGVLQANIDAVEASGVPGAQGPQGPIGPTGPSGAQGPPGSDADAIALSGYFQQQVDLNASGISGNSNDLAVASGLLQGDIDANTNALSAASGHLQGEIDLARFQILMAFGSGGSPAFSSSSSTYELVAIFEYPGSDHIVNPPENMVVYANVNQANKSGAIRLYDVTNDAVIGETEFIGNTDIEQQTVAMSGLPAEAATFELQIRTLSGGGSVSVYTATMI